MTVTQLNVDRDAGPALPEALERLQDLVFAGDVEAARALVEQMSARWPEAEQLATYARVLAPAHSSCEPGGPGWVLDADREWLRRHAHEHAGSWVALYGGRLLAAEPRLEHTLALAREKTDASD